MTAEATALAQRCGAKTRSGGVCKNRPVTGRTRCRMHGGSSPRGIAAPAWIHGRYSRHAPERMQAKISEYYNSTDLLDLSSEVALLQARISELLGELDTNESGAAWAAMVKHLSDLRTGFFSNDSDKFGQALDAALAVSRFGLGQSEKWEEITEHIEQLRKLIESESRRRINIGMMQSYEEVVSTITAILGIVKNNVSDSGELERIRREIYAIIDTDYEIE